MSENIVVNLNTPTISGIDLVDIKPSKRELKTTYYTTDTKSSSSAFTSLTFNVWMESEFISERINKLCKIIHDESPDLICLQELTEHSFNLIQTKLKPFYQIFQVFIEEENQYGMCLMCKISTVNIVAAPYYYDYSNTKMGRRIIGCEIEFKSIPDKKFNILTTHLENLAENEHIRADQFNVIEQVIKPITNCILIGDFSIYKTFEEVEQKISKSKLVDAWVNIGCPYKIKYTYNYKKNSNIDTKTQARLDRVLFAFEGNEYKVDALELVGIDDISHDVPIPLSNHFGLLAHFSTNEES